MECTFKQRRYLTWCCSKVKRLTSLLLLNIRSQPVSLFWNACKWILSQWLFFVNNLMWPHKSASFAKPWHSSACKCNETNIVLRWISYPHNGNSPRVVTNDTVACNICLICTPAHVIWSIYCCYNSWRGRVLVQPCAPNVGLVVWWQTVAVHSIFLQIRKVYLQSREQLEKMTSSTSSTT